MPTCGILGGDLVERALPQVAGEGEHVGLVHQRDVLAAVPGHGQLERVADRPLDAHPGVDRALGGHLVRRALAQHAALADVRALGVLADHHEVVRLGVAGRGADERALVDVQVELEAHLQQQAALDHARAAPPGVPTAPSRMASKPRSSSSISSRQDLAVAQVAGAAEVEVGGVEVDAGGADHLQGLGRHLRADAVAADHCNSMCSCRAATGDRLYDRRPISAVFIPMATTQLSRAAFERLQAEYDDLTTRGRIEVAQKIEPARLLGDLSENGDYHAAKDEQGHMEGRIRQLEHLLENAEIVEAGDEGVVAAGSIVTILYEGDADDMAERYLVGHIEEKIGDLDVICPQSPLGAALLGAGGATWVEYEAPNGMLRVRVLKVESA